MRIFLVLTLLVTLSVTLSGPAMAQIQDPILTMPDGQVILNISAVERREVEQDLLIANLSYVATNTESRALQNEINEAMANALSEAKKISGVKVNTSAYQVYERTDPRTKEKKLSLIHI